MSDVSVICRDCGTLLGGPEAGSRVMWTICGCKDRPAPKLPWWKRIFGASQKGDR